MAEAPNGRGLTWLLAAKVACCAGLLLAATGALSLGGLGSWLLDGGYVWPAIAVLAVAMLTLWRRHRAEGLPPAQRRKRRSRSAT